MAELLRPDLRAGDSLVYLAEWNLDMAHVPGLSTGIRLCLCLLAGLSAEEETALATSPVRFASPTGTLRHAEDAAPYRRWGLNVAYVTVSRNTTREDLEATLQQAHAAGMSVYLWNCAGREPFCERFQGLDFDAYYYDEPGFPGPWLGQGYHQGGYRGYTEPFRALFDEHLRKRYDEATRQEQFGLEDGVVRELPRDGLRAELRGHARPSPRLWYEFLRWHNVLVRDRLREESQAIQARFPGSATFPCLSPCYLDAGPRYAGCDYALLAREAVFERVQVDPYVHIRMTREYWVSYVVSLMRTACQGKPLDCWTCTWHGYGTKPVDMFEGPMCAFAQGVQGYCFWAYHHATQAQWRPDYRARWAQIGRAVRFIRAHTEVTRRAPRNQVALYFPHQCYYVKYFDAPWTKHGGVWGAGYFAERTYYSLARAHVPSDVVLPVLGEEAGLRTALQPYRVLVVPEASFLSDLEVRQLRDWVENGGTLVATGPLGTHEPWGAPRAMPPLAEVTGVRYGAARERKFLCLQETAKWLPSFRAGAQLRCHGWPVEQFLALDRAPATYAGTGSDEENQRTFRYAVERLGEADQKACALELVGAQVLGTWDDGSPALTVHAFGRGRVFSCAAVDATVGYELVPWEDPDRLRLLGDLCRAGAELPETALPADVEVQLLHGDGCSVTLFNHGAPPVPPAELSFPIPSAPGRARFFTTEDQGALAVEYVGGRVRLRLPAFLDFLLCDLEGTGGTE